MPDITNYDGRLEQMANYCEQMLDNIAKVNNVYHDSVENAYVAVLPDKFLKWKTINKIGGKTLAWNQLVDTGTTEVATISGHKYYTLINGTASIVTSDGTAISVADDTADMVTDLTLCFGSGNEPATTNDFTDVFPAAHYDYEPGTLLSAGVTEVESKDSSDNTLQSYSVPASVQALDGYGWSAGSVYNYIDYEAKKYVQNVGRVDLGTLNWNYISVSNFERFVTTIDGIKWARSGSIPSNAVTTKYVAISSDVFIGGGTDKVMYGFVNSSNFAIRDTTYTDAAAFKNSLSGVYLYYELATPVETDISQYLTDDNLINVESGGTLTFHHSNGDDYNIPVPVELEYIGV